MVKCWIVVFLYFIYLGVWCIFAILSISPWRMLHFPDVTKLMDVYAPGLLNIFHREMSYWRRKIHSDRNCWLPNNLASIPLILKKGVMENSILLCSNPMIQMGTVSQWFFQFVMKLGHNYYKYHCLKLLCVLPSWRTFGKIYSEVSLWSVIGVLIFSAIFVWLEWIDCRVFTMRLDNPGWKLLIAIVILTMASYWLMRCVLVWPNV